MGLLNGQFAIVTGAASARGLGKSMATLFAEHGATVAVLDLDEAAAKAAAADIGPQHIGLACDVTDKAACTRAASSLIETWDRVDILVNNAGITQPLKIMDIEPTNYDAVLDVNLRGTLYMSQAPHAGEQKRLHR
jgi:NAD(P)-dependent dehydrogenase (short-subunit alcohol dehydrogenase family)